MPARGFTLLELMIALAIAAILLMVATPSFTAMIANTQIKSAAESLLSGMRLARAEAIKRNAPMRFHLVSTLAANCAYAGTSSLWVVSQTDQVSYGQVEGKCDHAPALPADPCDASCDGNPYIAYKSQGTVQTDTRIHVVADAAVITFGPLGQVLPNFEGSASLSQATVNSTLAGTKSWRVAVTAPSGSLKLCDPARASGLSFACT